MAKGGDSAGTRRLSLAPSRRRPREGFTTKARPGRSYGGEKELNGFFKRMQAAFDELDSELKSTKW